jgi:uncharacterized membrane protein
MSGEEREEARRIAAEAVKDHLEITEKTRLKTSIKNAAGIMTSVVIATVAVCTLLNKISNSQDRIELSLGYKVSEEQFKDWAADLATLNRTIDPAKGLVVPKPALYRSPTRPNPPSEQ